MSGIPQEKVAQPKQKVETLMPAPALKTEKELSKTLKADVIDHALALQEHCGGLTSRVEELTKKLSGLQSEVTSHTEAMEKDASRISTQEGTIRRLQSHLERARDENASYQQSNTRLRRDLVNEREAHQKTRERVKNPPRIKIDSNALLDMSKNGRDSDSNLSLQFGNCDVTVTAPPKKEERRPRRDRVGDIMSRLGKDPGMSGVKLGKSPLSDMMYGSIAKSLAEGGITECPICLGTNPLCPIDGLLSGSEGVPSDCRHGGHPSTDCELCPESCRYKGMPAELAKVIGARTEDGRSVFDEILFMVDAMSVPEGKDSPSGALTMSDILGRRRPSSYM